MRRDRIVIVGAGIAGLSAGLALSAKGYGVTVLERAAHPGGKIRNLDVAGRPVASGPTVFTMRWVFDELFDQVGENLERHVTLTKVDTLARHAWQGTGALDLYSDIDRSADAIAAFAGAAEARNYRDFAREAQRVHDLLDKPFMRDPQPSHTRLAVGVGPAGLATLARLRAANTMWAALSRHFRNERLRQLFGRYATYCGSSPYQAAATLMLVAHVERAGVWLVDGGMATIPKAMAGLIEARGGTVRYDTDVAEILTSGGRVEGVRLADDEEIAADAIIFGGDVAALATGAMGLTAARAVPRTSADGRSLSALTFSIVGKPHGFELHHHTVFFSPDYRAEFDDLFERGRLPVEPTVYICAQDRSNDPHVTADGPERFLIILNAPPTGDSHPFTPKEIEQCERRTFDFLERCGLTIDQTPGASVVTTPADFHRMFPATGGAIYGQASHGWSAPFERPTARTRLPGLYVASGSAHPGPGVPMSALSGRMAAAAVMADRAST